MSNIYAINPNLGVTQKITLLNQMILALSGMVEGATFDKNELDSIYSNLFISRQYLRKQGIGNTLSTYTGWTDISDQSGYSIWRYAPTNYSYSTLNQFYLNGQAFTNRGLAASESATAFDKVYLYEADSTPGYVNEINAGQTNLSTSFYTLASTLDYMYFGSSATFGGLDVVWKARGAGYTLVVQYWSGTAWVTMGPANQLVDDTNAWQSNGVMTWTIPLNWNQTAVNGVTKYWIRISTTTNPTINGLAYYMIPATSVVGLLALSSTDIINQNWCWCTYGTSIYVTLPNAGGFNGEGLTFIKSSSSLANLQNFFIYNNPITGDYQSSQYNTSPGSGDVKYITSTPYTILNTDGILFVQANTPMVLTLPSAVGLGGKEYTIKHTGGASSVTLYGASGNRIDGAASYTLNAIYQFVTCISDGENWYIINAGTA